jgi:hypothetical protein
MVSRTRVSGILGTVIALQVVVLVTNLEQRDMVRRIDKTVESNAKTLSEHASKLAIHDNHFQAILEGTFSSKEFAANVGRFIPNETR